VVNHGTQAQGISVGHPRNKSLVPRITVPDSETKTKKANPDLTEVCPCKIIRIDLLNQNGICSEERYFGVKYGPNKVGLFFFT